MKKILLWSLMALTACAPTTSANFRSSTLEQEPSVKVEVGLNPTMPNLKTFVVIPLSEFSEDAGAKGITAQHLAFQARNYMELLGYRFIEKKDEADLKLFVDSSNNYSETYIPASQYTVPIYVPSTTARYNSNTNGYFNYNGGYSGWGTYSGTTSGSVNVPGYYTSQTYSREGYSKGLFYPAVSVIVYDAKTQKEQVIASGVGTSQNSDVRVSAQNLMYRIFAQMPPANFPDNPTKSGQIGFFVVPWTSDGNTYYPIITDVTKDLPAEKAGLRFGDFILTIDGQSTANRPDVEIGVLLAGEAGQEKILVINRGTEVKTVKIMMIARK
ncbi:PDZ domain-containing protein [Deinococcus sp. AJ005]|uniref:PDZ domain-containing protein n=1 Tax=Deinococcus sp. AJ005 TaxID=2652443 RepID=UPI00186588AD|nr:PDZ domain-containing protein [Deinococcus sp. AJ005]